MRFEIGDGDKCLTCEEGTNRWESCNPGYILADGRCKVQKHYYSFKAVYRIDTENEEIDLIKYLDLENIKETTIDGTKVESCTKYTFPAPGEREVTYYVDLSKSNELIKMFHGISNLVLYQNISVKTEKMKQWKI